jgi:hypothetical protein
MDLLVLVEIALGEGIDDCRRRRTLAPRESEESPRINARGN